MTIEAQLFDGTIVEFPDGTDRSVIEKTVKRLTAERQPKEPEEKESVLRQAADIPVNFAKGISQGVRMLSDAFGADNAVSASLRGVEDYLGRLLSAQAKNNQEEIGRIFKEAEDKGVLEQVKAGLKAFAVAPVDIMSQAFGTIIPTLAGGLAGQALKIGARTAAVGTGAVMGTGIGKSSIYDAVTDELKQTGLPEELVKQAATQAQEYGGQNLDLILANTLLGGVAAGTGIERALIPGMVKNISANLAKRGVIGRGLATGAPELLTEGAQGGTEQLTQNIALQREGFDVPTFRGVGTAATMEAVAGGTLGAGVGAFSRPQAPYASPEAAPEVPLAVSPEAPTDISPEPPLLTERPPAPLTPEQERQLAIDQQIARQNAFQAQFETPAGAPETPQQAYERQMAQQAQRTPVRPITEPQPQSQFLGVGEAAIQPGQRERAQGLAAQEFGLNVGQARAPVTEQDRIARQLAAQQEMDADRFQQQTPQPVITPAQAQLRTSAPIPSARAIDRQAALLGQRAGLPQVEQEGLAAQADIAGGTGQVALPQTRFVDLTPMPPRAARQRLAALKADAPDADLNIVPHPQMSGRFAIEERVAPAPEAPASPRGDRPSVSYEQAVQMVRNVERTGVLTPEAIAAAQQYGLNIDPTLMQFVERTTPENLLVQQRRGMADEAALNAELRGGVATPEEAQRLREVGMGRPYDQVASLEPRAPAALGKGEREQRLEQEFQAEQQAARANLQGPTLQGTSLNARPAPQAASAQFTEQFMAPEGRYSLSGNATPEAKQAAEDFLKIAMPMLKRFGLGNVGLRLVESIKNGGADGMYAQQVITLALDSDNPLGVMRHEVIHALKELGAFTPAEWKVLSKAAKDKWIDQFFSPEMQQQYKDVYLEQNGDLKGFDAYMQEEAIAQAFRFYTETKPPAGRIANIMRRLNKFFAALRNFLNGQGFQNADEMFLPNRIFADIERGAITPGREQGRVEETPAEWKATPADIAQAAEYEMVNGIAPYLSEGQLELAVPMARYSIKPAYTPKQIAKGDGDNHPILGLPLNKNGTVTLYLPTNNAEARRIAKEKKLKGNTPDTNRIYLTNESSGPKVMNNPGNIDHTMDGANVLIQVDPAYLQLDQEYADGRKDFFIQIAEGEAFAKKMAQTKLFTLDAPRDRAISKETTLKEIEAKIKDGVDNYKQMSVKDKRARLKEARRVLKEQHNVGTLLSENGKLQKTRVGDYGIKFDGNSVASMGLGLASAQKITEKLSSCPRSARCESLCLGETSGQNLLYGGDGQFKSGPRLSQYLKTEAMVLNPEDFAIVLYEEISKFKSWANEETGTETIVDEDGKKVVMPKQVYKPAIRLNVTSDFAPKTFEPIIEAFPDVEFYDYTKLNTQTIAPNHHLTYSSDGVAQEVNGQVVGVGSNWKEMTKKLDSGKNVAMAFTSRKAMPEFLLDEATGKKYQVWNGDNYDARFLDPKPGEKGNKLNQGMIIGLTNKDRTGKPEDAAIKNDGFFVDYDPARDGKTLTIKDQSKFVKEQTIAMPGAKFSLRAPTTPEFKRFFGKSKITNPDGTPKVMYHGTARIIDEFIPKQAGAIFVTKNPEFAEIFTNESLQYMVREQINAIEILFKDMSPKEQLNLMKKGYKLAVKEKFLSKKAVDQEIAELIDMVNQGMSLTNEFHRVAESFAPSIERSLESGRNIMPLYVRAENPFDYENPEHLAALNVELNKRSDAYGQPLGDKTVPWLRNGSWENIERPEVQNAIKELGYDGFYVQERGEKNLAVYNPNQIKSAIGNRGTYDETGRILYSLKNAPPNRYTKLAPDDPTAGKAVIDAATSAFNAVRNDGTRTGARINLIDRYSGMSRTLESIPLFSDGKLRADMLHHAKAQGINLIKGGLLSGTPILNDDGTIGIERSENNLARAAYLADRLNSNKNVVESGLSGRAHVAEVARILRGADILAEDAELRKLGDKQIIEAKRMSDELKKLVKQGVTSPKSVAAAQKAIDNMRRIGNANRKMNRELQIKPEDIAWAKKQLDLVPEVQEVLDIWKNVNTSLVNLWEDTGLLDKETADKYRAAKNYVPLFKSREDLNEEAFFQTGSGTKTTAKIKKLEGADIARNIWENIDKQYAVMIAAAYENQTRRVSVEQMRSIDPKLADITNASDPRVNLRYRDGGKDVHVVIENPNDLAAFQSMSYQLSPVMKFFGGFTNVLRAGALLNPMFWIRQLIRDPIHATIAGQSGIVTPVHSAAEFMRIITKNSEEARILASRGVIGQFDSTVSLNEFLGEVGKDKQQPPGVVQRSLHKLMQIHEASDAATRVSIFKKAKAKALKDGMSEAQAIDYAVFKARESINFAVTGNSPALANARQMIPFLNATIVGLDTLYRAATGYGLNPEEKAEARRMFRNRAMMLTAMSFAYAMSMQDDDDYKKLPDYVKDGNWLVPMSTEEGKTFVKVSVPYEVGFIFKTLPELFVRYMAGTSTGKETLAAFRAGLIHNMPTGGVPIPQFAKPAFEAVTNHSFFTNRPIEGMGDQRLPVAQRGQKASEFAKMMSGLGLDEVGLSPAKIDVLTKGYFAEFGAFFNELTDALISFGSGKEKTPRNIENLPFMRAFLTDPQVNKAIGDFYDIEKNATEVANEFTKYKNEGRGEDLQKMLSDPEKVQKVGAAPVLRQISKGMSEIQKAIRIIDNSRSMPPEERRARINELQKQLGQLAERGYQIAGSIGLNR